MNKQIINNWIAALRSGWFEQTTDVYFNPDEDSYCAVGVCLAADPKAYIRYSDFLEDVVITLITDEGRAKFDTDKYSDIIGIPNRGVADRTYSNDLRMPLMRYVEWLNDYEEVSFEDIANYLDVVLNGNWDCLN